MNATYEDIRSGSADVLTLESLSDETINIMVAAMPPLREFLRLHSNCSGVFFTSTKAHCVDCANPVHTGPHEPGTIVHYGGARAAIKRAKLGKSNKQRHRAKMRAQIAAQSPTVFPLR